MPDAESHESPFLVDGEVGNLEGLGWRLKVGLLQAEGLQLFLPAVGLRERNILCYKIRGKHRRPR